MWNCYKGYIKLLYGNVVKKEVLLIFSPAVLCQKVENSFSRNNREIQYYANPSECSVRKILKKYNSIR